MAHTFISWYRQGLAAQITAPPASTDLRIKLNFTAEAQAGSTTEQVTQALQLAGPADVAGFNTKVVIRTEPAPGTANFEWAYLPFVEFYDEDLPWRFTPKQVEKDRLPPWLVLFVLKKNDGEFARQPPASGANLPVIEVKGPMLAIPPEQSWSWAHVQVTHDAVNETGLKNLLQEKPDRGLSRILCPRRLDPNTEYQAFLVPAFEAGRKAGLGLPPVPADVLKASWQSGQSSQLFPYYYEWSFDTGAEGDLESLLRRLKPWSAAGVPLPRVSIAGLPGEVGAMIPPKLFGQPSAHLELFTLLTPARRSPAAYVGNANVADRAVRQKLADWLAQAQTGGVPTLTPVCGARYHQQKTFDPQKKDWWNELNLDPRYRALVSLGAAVVRKNQDQWMKEAEAMAGDLTEANQRLRQAKFAVEVGKSVIARHLQVLDPVRLVSLVKPLHGAVKTGANTTLADDLRSGLISGAGSEAAFRRVLKKAQPRANAALADYQGLVNQINTPGKATSAAKPKRPPFPAPNAQDTWSNAYDPNTPEGQYIDQLKNYNPPPPAARIPTALNTALAGKIQSTVAPADNLLRQLNADYTFTNQQGQAAPLLTLDPIQASPMFHEPLFDEFAAEASAFMAPQLSAMPANSLTLLEVNQAVIEAFLIGVNDEMGREFRWRRFPADPRATYFANFWNTADSGADPDDVDPLHGWSPTSTLGTHRPIKTPVPKLFLVFRGDVFGKFQDAVIYLAPTIPKSNPPKPNLDAPVLPLMHGTLPPDLLTIGFQLDLATVQAAPGYFLVIEERAGSVRLGLDVSATLPIVLPVQPAQLAWPHLTKPYADANEIATGVGQSAATVTSAELATTLYQQPVRLCIPLSTLLS